MQYKGFLLALSITLSAFSLHAQQYQHISRSVLNKGIHTDTIVVKKGTPKDLVSCTVPYKKVTDEYGYKPVPLLGPQSHFGDMNDYVTNFVRHYLSTHDKTLSYIQDRSSQPFSVIDNILQKNNMPSELKYIAVIESALNHNAVSHAGAVGPWQLMSSTARLMGLTVNKHKDDRRDWYKSTNAAVKYLTTLYGQLNDWLLVIAAYNSGPAPVLRAIQRTGSHSFWDIKKYLPHETQGYVLSFIATASIFENLNKFIGMGSIPSDFDFSNPNPAVKIAAEKKPEPKVNFTKEELENMAIVHIKEPVSLELISQVLNIDLTLLNKWNPDYEGFLYDPSPAQAYDLRIPKDKVDNFLQKKEAMQKRSKQIFDEASM